MLTFVTLLLIDRLAWVVWWFSFLFNYLEWVFLLGVMVVRLADERLACLCFTGLVVIGAGFRCVLCGKFLT